MRRTVARPGTSRDYGADLLSCIVMQRITLGHRARDVVHELLGRFRVHGLAEPGPDELASFIASDDVYTP